MSDRPHRVSSSPRAVAAAERIIASARTWRTTRQRVAPTASRTIQSRTRRLDRAITRLAALTQAIASTSIGTTISATICAAILAGSFIQTRRTDTLARFSARVDSRRSRSSSACAATCSIVASGRRRPT